MILGAGGLTAAVAVAAPGLGLPSTSNSSITNSPKEVIDQVWQIVYRDFLDSTGKYSADSWTRLRKDLLSKMLVKDPKDRIRIEDVIEHAYFAEVIELKRKKPAASPSQKKARNFTALMGKPKKIA